MYVPFCENGDVEPMTEDELKLAAQAADEQANHRFQNEEY